MVPHDGHVDTTAERVFVFLSVFLFRNENVRRDPTKMHTGDVERSCPPEANRFDELRE